MKLSIQKLPYLTFNNTGDSEKGIGKGLINNAINSAKTLTSKYKDSKDVTTKFFVENLIRKCVFGLPFAKYLPDSTDKGIDIKLNPNSSRFTLDIKTKTLSSLISSLKGDIINENFKWDVSAKKNYSQTTIFTILDDTTSFGYKFKIYFVGYISKQELLRVPLKNGVRDIPITSIHLFKNDKNFWNTFIQICCLNDEKEYYFWHTKSFGTQYGDMRLFMEQSQVCEKSLYIGEKYSYIITRHIPYRKDKYSGAQFTLQDRIKLYISKSPNVFELYRTKGSISNIMNIFEEKYNIAASNYSYCLTNLIEAIEYRTKDEANKCIKYIKELK